MIAGTYIGSAVVLAVLTILFVQGTLGVWGFMAFLLVTFLLGLRRRELGLPDRVGDLPDGDARAGHRLLLRHRHRRRRHQRPVPVREDDRVRRGVAGRDRVLPRRGGDGRRRDRGAVVRRRGRAGGARGHRQAAHRPGRRGGRRARPRRTVRRRPARASASATSQPRRPRASGDGAIASGRDGPRGHPACSSPLRPPRTSSSARFRPSNRHSRTAGRPSGASCRGWSARATGARGASRRHCARRSSPGARAASRATASARPASSCSRCRAADSPITAARAPQRAPIASLNLARRRRSPVS